MENIDPIIEILRAAVAEDASAEARGAGAAACREILHRLEPHDQEHPTLASPMSECETARPTMPEVAALAAAIRTVPIDQLLDLAVAKLRALVPDMPAKPATPGLSIPLIPVTRSTS